MRCHMNRSNLTKFVTGLVVISLTLLSGCCVLAQTTPDGTLAGKKGDTVLSAAEATKLLPPAVFFGGQSATTQLRNSGGVKFADGMFVLAVMVDTSGYSSDIQQKYQAYLITEVPIKIDGHDLPVGVYGVGFVAENKFILLDVGAHELFSVTSHSDAAMKRPTPLKVVADGKKFRLYEGRSYVSIER